MKLDITQVHSTTLTFADLNREELGTLKLIFGAFCRVPNLLCRDELCELRPTGGKALVVSRFMETINEQLRSLSLS